MIVVIISKGKTGLFIHSRRGMENEAQVNGVTQVRTIREPRTRMNTGHERKLSKVMEEVTQKTQTMKQQESH